MSAELVSHVGLWVVCLVNLVLILVLYRQFGLVAMATAAGHDNDGVSIGLPAPPLQVRELESTDPVSLNLDSTWSIIMFGTPHCDPCTAVMDRLGAEAAALADANVRVIAVLSADESALRNLRNSKSYSFETYLDHGGLTSVAWQIRVTPFLMLVAPNGRVASKALASTESRLSAFLDRVWESTGAGSVHEART
jgi:AhpC/TSA family